MPEKIQSVEEVRARVLARSVFDKAGVVLTKYGTAVKNKGFKGITIGLFGQAFGAVLKPVAYVSMFYPDHQRIVSEVLGEEPGNILLTMKGHFGNHGLEIVNVGMLRGKKDEIMYVPLVFWDPKPDEILVHDTENLRVINLLDYLRTEAGLLYFGAIEKSLLEISKI